MAALPGAKAGFWRQKPGASSSATTGESMTRIGTTLEYYITARTKAWWDPEQSVVVYDGISPITGCIIDHAGGYVTLPAAPSGTVTVDCYYYEMDALCGAYGVKVDPKSSEVDITTFSCKLNSEVKWKKWAATLKEFQVSVQRHLFLGYAWLETAFTTPDSNLIWRWKAAGTAGNSESVEYVISGNDTVLQIARAANKTTVTVGTGPAGAATSTAQQVRAHLEADAVLAALWELEYPDGETGQGIVEALTEESLDHGHDWDDLTKLGEKVLCCIYLDNTTGSLKKLEGVGILTATNPDAKVDALVESDLTFRGTDRLRYHTV